MDIDGNVALWAGLVGIVLPLAIATVNQSTWHPRARGIVAFLACCIAAAGTAYFAGDFNDEGDLATAFLTMLTAAFGSYSTYWKPSTIAPSWERTTTF